MFQHDDESGSDCQSLLTDDMFEPQHPKLSRKVIANGNKFMLIQDKIESSNCPCSIFISTCFACRESENPKCDFSAWNKEILKDHRRVVV